MAPDTQRSGEQLSTPRNCLQSKWDAIFDKDVKEWIAFKPALGLHVYPCYACRHMFFLKKSFQDHVNRRAVLLEYNCPGCNEIMMFYNRCAFQLHCRKHYSLEKGTICLNNLEVSTLPIGLAGFSKHPDIAYLFDVEEELIVGNTFMNAQFYAPRIEERGKETISLVPSHLVINRTDQTGENQSLALKQIAKNIPKCQFISLQNLKELRINLHSSDEDADTPVEVKIEPEDNAQQVTFSEEPFAIQESRAEQSQKIQSNTSNVNCTSQAANSLNSAGIPPEVDVEDLMLPVITKVETVEEPLSPQPKSGSEQKCPECGQQCEDSLKDHFLGSNRPTSEKLRCSSCRLICPTICSFRAHVRIHDRLAPFVCPDCGEKFPEVEKLITHMDDVCFHSAKSVRYRCPGRRCGKIFASEATFGPHFRELHIGTMYQCDLCKEIFTALQAGENHMSSHEERTSLVKYFSCVTCGDYEMTPNQLKSHIDFHCKDLTRCMYIFMCKYCKCYFRSVGTMATHLKNCKVQKTGVPRRVRPTTTTNPYMNSKYVSGECQLCKNRIIFLKTKPIDYCTKCSARPIHPPKKVPTKAGERCTCILCKKQIDFAERRQHKRDCKYGRPQVFVERLDLEKVEARASYFNQSFSSSNSEESSEGSPQKHRNDLIDDSRPRKRHRPSKPKKPEMENDLTAEEPILFDGTYQCRLCDYKTTDRTPFHNHIKVHRHISTAYQCMECGECFVVKPSLVKHLLHFHNISNNDQYFTDNDCFDQTAVTELAKVVKAPYLANNVKENQCKVCMEQFDSSEKLDKHFRTHGMAFLMQKSI